MMTRKDVFLKLGGLDQNNLKVGFNDMDYCLRLREKGYSIIYTPYAKLYHHEHASRGTEINPEEVKFFQRKHRAILKNGDPYYNPNLTVERLDYSLRISDAIQN
jgi:GT2 family glycosyltransferase